MDEQNSKAQLSSAHTTSKQLLEQIESGEVPKSWAVERVDAIFDLQHGATLSPKRRQGINPHPFLRTSNVLWGYLDLSSVDCMDFSPDEVAKLALKKDDLLVCEGGEIGRTAMWNDELPRCCFQNHIHRLRSNGTHQIIPEFYMYWMQAAFLLLNRYRGQSNKTTIANLSGSRLNSFLVPYPPLPEQRAIARALRVVQEATAARQREIELEQERKAALMQHLFTRGTREESRKETEIGEMPESWRLVELAEISRVASGGTPNRGEPEYWKGDIPWVKTGEINYNKITSTEEMITKKGLESSAAQIIPAGTLLMAMYGQGVTRGRVAVLGIDAAVNQACAAIFTSEEVSTEFLFHFLTYDYARIRNLGHGANQRNLNSMIIRSIKIPLPDLKEQQTIASALNACNMKKLALERERAFLDELFDALIEELMTGRLSVEPLTQRTTP